MRKRLPGAVLLATTLALGARLAALPAPAPGQNAAPAAKPKAGPVPRMRDGKPDMQGFWETEPRLQISAAIEEHGNAFGIRASPRVIDTPDGKIPYQPWALAERDRRRREGNAYEDPEGKCALGGVPHQMYVLFPVVLFLQPPGAFVMTFEYVHAYRHVDMTRTKHYPDNIRLWQGDSIGRWDGDVLVIDTTNLNGKPWLELYGDFVGADAHIVERMTMRDSNTIDYTATIDDPKTFTKPWSMAFSFLRGEYEQLYEENCHETNVDLEHMKRLYDAAHADDKK